MCSDPLSVTPVAVAKICVIRFSCYASLCTRINQRLLLLVVVVFCVLFVFFGGRYCTRDRFQPEALNITVVATLSCVLVCHSETFYKHFASFLFPGVLSDSVSTAVLVCICHSETIHKFSASSSSSP